MVYDNVYLERLNTALQPLLPQWGMDENAVLRLLTFSENATFMAEDLLAARRLILRVHRPGYTPAVEINSELCWLQALRNESDISIGAPVAMQNGEYIATLRTGDSETQVVAFEFVPGKEPASTEDLRHWYYRLGQTAGQLHLHSQGWQRPDAFTRKTWNISTIIGEQGFWGDWRAQHPFSEDELAVLNRTESDIKARLNSYGDSADRFGLVHCDMRLANLLIDGDKLTVIDFDDCGICWFGWDFATAVSFIEDDANLDDYRRAWVEGYRTVRTFTPQDEAILPVLIMLRRLQLTAWIASHSETPTAQSLKNDWAGNTLKLAGNYLNNRRVTTGTTQDA